MGARYLSPTAPALEDEDHVERIDQRRLDYMPLAERNYGEMSAAIERGRR